MASASTMDCLLSLHRDYLTKRKVFGDFLIDKPLHLRTLAGMEVVFRATSQFFLYLTSLLGKSECASTTSDKTTSLLRLLTPILKLYTAKLAIIFTQEAQELFGGYGFMNDSGLGSILADCQVNTIWEGTTNVLSLDLVRVLVKHPQSIEVFINDAKHRLQEVHSQNIKQLSDVYQKVTGLFNSIELFCFDLLNQNFSISSIPSYEASARFLAFHIGYTCSALLLLEQAARTRDELDFATVQRWLDGTFDQSVNSPGSLSGKLQLLTPADLEMDKKLALFNLDKIQKSKL